MRALGELSPRYAPGSSSCRPTRVGAPAMRVGEDGPRRALALSSSSSLSDKRNGRGGGGRWQGERRALALTLGRHRHETLHQRFVSCVCWGIDPDTATWGGRLPKKGTSRDGGISWDGLGDLGELWIELKRREMRRERETEKQGGVDT